MTHLGKMIAAKAFMRGYSLSTFTKEINKTRELKFAVTADDVLIALDSEDINISFLKGIMKALGFNHADVFYELCKDLGVNIEHSN